MTLTTRFLVCTDSPHIATQLRSELQGYAVVKHVSGPKAACELLLDTRWSWAGAIVASLDVDTAPWARALRSYHPSLPIMAVLPKLASAQTHALRAEGFETSSAPVPLRALHGFAQRCLATSFLPDERVAAVVVHLAREHDLTCREVQLLTASLGGRTREDIRDWVGIGENTLKSQVRGLLRKTGFRNVDVLVNQVLRDALLGNQPREVARPTLFPRTQTDVTQLGAAPQLQSA